jgi:hypothetical protein
MSKRKKSDEEGEEEEMRNNIKRLRVSNENFPFSAKDLPKKCCFYPENTKIRDAAARLVHGGFTEYMNARTDIVIKNRDAQKNLLTDWTNLPRIEHFVDSSDQYLHHAKTAIMYVRQYFVQTHVQFSTSHPYETSNHEFTWAQMVPYIRFYIEQDSYCVTV